MPFLIVIGIGISLISLWDSFKKWVSRALAAPQPADHDEPLPAQGQLNNKVRQLQDQPVKRRGHDHLQYVYDQFPIQEHALRSRNVHQLYQPGTPQSQVLPPHPLVQNDASGQHAPLELL